MTQPIEIKNEDEQTLFELFDAQSLNELDAKFKAWIGESRATQKQIEINALKLELQRAKQTPSIRDFCESIRLDRINNYLTNEVMADHQGLKTETLEAFLWLCETISKEDY